jgi:cAMP-dependent protein kinase regulator
MTFSTTPTFLPQFKLPPTEEYTQLLTELHEIYCQDQPEDVLQYCFNFFNNKLQEQRADFFRSEQPLGTFIKN